MKPAHITFLLLALAATGCIAPKTIEQHIIAHGRRLEAQEHRPARMVAEGDLDGDGVSDTAAIYTLEGAHHSNTYEQFLVVHSSRGRGRLLHTIAGGKDFRSIDGVRIVGGRVELAVLEYGPSDASCCPSRRADTAYVLTGGGLSELRRTPPLNLRPQP